MLARSRALPHLQTGLLLATVLLTTGPFALPDPLGLGPRLSSALVGLFASTAIAFVELLDGRWPVTRVDRVIPAYVAAFIVSLAAFDDRTGIAASAAVLASQISLFWAAALVARREPRAMAYVFAAFVAGTAAVQLMTLGGRFHLGLGMGTAGLSAGSDRIVPEIGRLAVLQLAVLLAAHRRAVTAWSQWAVGGLIVITTFVLVVLDVPGALTAAALVLLAAAWCANRRLAHRVFHVVCLAAGMGLLLFANAAIQIRINDAVASACSTRPSLEGLALIVVWLTFAWRVRAAGPCADHPVAVAIFLGLTGIAASNFFEVGLTGEAAARSFPIGWILLGFAGSEGLARLHYGSRPVTAGGSRTFARIREWSDLLPRYWWVPFMLLVLLARRPDAFNQAQFWAEDATVFHYGAEVNGARSLVQPYAGYHVLAARLVAFTATGLVDARWLPLAFNVSATAFILVVCASLGVRRWTGPPAGLCALALVMSWQADEIFVDITNLQWVLCLTIVVCGLIPPPSSRLGQWAEAALLMLAGLTGPFAVIFWPLIALRLWFHRGAAVPSFAALTIAAILQVVALMHPHGVPPPPPGLDRAAWTRIIGLRLFAQPFLPRSWWPASGPAQLTTAIFGLAITVTMAFYPGPRRRFRALLFFAVVLVQVAIGFRMHPMRDILLLGPDLAPRYFFDARILLAWLVFTVATGAFPAALRRVAIVCAAAYFVVAILSFRIPPLPNLGWPRYAAAVREGRPAEIPVNPVPWIYQYPGRPAR